MARLYVCSLTKVVDTVRSSGARSLVTILTAGASLVRPCEIKPGAPSASLRLGHRCAAGGACAGQWRAYREPARLRRRHGTDASRWSFIAMPASAARRRRPSFSPARSRRSAAKRSSRVELRRASPTATPNRRLVALADRILRRDGRMCEAIEGIGRGADCFEGAPFALELA